MLELLDHQKLGVAWLRERPRALLADEPGLGKSAQVLLAGEEPFLVAAPAMVLDSGTWDDEVEKWAPGADVTQVSYTSLMERGVKGRVPRDRNGWPKVKLRPEYQGHYRTAVGDESHYLKGRKTSWTAGFYQLDADSMFLATGTPVPNWAHEAFTSLQLIRPELAKPGAEFGSYWRWAKQWFHVGPTFDRAGRQLAQMDVGEFKDEAHLSWCRECEGPPRTWKEFRAQNWSDRMLLRLREDCLDLPPLTIQPWRVRMGREQGKAYRELKKQFVTWLGSGTEVVAWNSAAQLIKLAKAATGLEVLERGAGASAKLDALRTILRDRPRPTLVVAHFRDSVNACERVAEEVGAEVRKVSGDVSRRDRREAIRSFKSGSLPVLVATIDTISEGMTLVAADQIVRVERSWRPSRNEQVIRRLHRIGQERPVLVVDLITDRTVDERVLDLLQSKSDQQMQALGLEELRGLAA